MQSSKSCKMSMSVNGKLLLKTDILKIDIVTIFFTKICLERMRLESSILFGWKSVI